MEPLRTIIVDDEPLARERLRTLLLEIGDLTIATECEGGAEAVDAIRRFRPDVVFLDIQMPGLDGFDVISLLDPDDVPAVVFCTAYDHYALRAFEANAVDYLLKPVNAARLRATLTRARERAESAKASHSPSELPHLAAMLAGHPERRARLAIREQDRFVVLRTEDIVWVEAADNYVLLHTLNGMHRYRATMAQLETMLDPGKFLRIHRSIILNVDQVKVIEPWGMGEHVFVLSDGRKLTSSRRYRKPIRDVFGC